MSTQKDRNEEHKNLDLSDQKLLEELKQAYQMIEKTRQTLTYRKTKLAVEQNLRGTHNPDTK